MFGCFHAGNKHSTDLIIFSQCRTVGKGPINIFYFTIAVKWHQLVFEHHRFTGDENFLQQRPDNVPYLTPDNDSFSSNGRMFSIYTQAWPECFVIKAKKLIAPEKEHGKSRMKYIVKSNAQAQRPLVNITNGCLRPIMIHYQLTYLACVF